MEEMRSRAGYKVGLVALGFRSSLGLFQLISYLERRGERSDTSTTPYIINSYNAF
jgi:hypothetical protein